MRVNMYSSRIIERLTILWSMSSQRNLVCYLPLLRVTYVRLL